MYEHIQLHDNSHHAMYALQYTHISTKYIQVTFIHTAACVDFTQDSYEVNEDDGVAEICVELEGYIDVDEPLVVYLFTIPGTAAGELHASET